ncbi:selenocysteine-specific translation elongation factor [Salibacterium halotolerans]|uniref:Selenocysteine-specific elongation factor n=1 Tax=Salibacterium halotolerans TaxID=1884432 RepID=A0A1I5UUK5_9BACI|nr:selenocysteine-specific translation elongation factor [Salibacterium halotolerans]SFP98868.1 selenocysteine-specific elongation factor [Salibacterium halotolerans]
MAQRMYTIGMAGHIDHGKTALTKALTDHDTDRLKEEKERSVSIEPGFAPLQLRDDMEVSIIDVPGHERFIRQMIAGVAGIDAVVLTVAADEGVMPQTKEHLEILSLLGVTGGLIAVTKADKVEEDLRELAGEDIRSEVQGTPFEQAEMVFVDSLSGSGIEQVRSVITDILDRLSVREARGAFRLPIDQVFSVHGQGTVVRGTVYEGQIKEGDTVQMLPLRKKGKIRQLQRHGTRVDKGIAGQRLAMNIGGVDREELKRGDVVVSAEHYVTTERLNVVLYTSQETVHTLKQRGSVKLHLGTAEVFGTIVFFDRNVLEPGEKQEVLCQLVLDGPVVTKRADRFILRRPSPMETIGGGWVLNPNAERLRFGAYSINRLQQEKQGTPEEHVQEALREYKWLSSEQLAKETGLLQEDAENVVAELLQKEQAKTYDNGRIALQELYDEYMESILAELRAFHEQYPLRSGKNKRELSLFTSGALPKELAERFFEEAVEQKLISRQKQYAAVFSHVPSYPEGWERRMEQARSSWHQDGIAPRPWQEYMDEQGIPKELGNEFRYALLQSGTASAMDDRHIREVSKLQEAKELLRTSHPGAFTLQQAKEILPVSRKFLVPFLEWLDEQKWTKWENEQRVWRNPNDNRT